MPFSCKALHFIHHALETIRSKIPAKIPHATLTPPPPSSAGSDALVYVNVVVSRGKEEQKGGPETCARVLPRKTHTRAHAQEWSKKQKEKETDKEIERETITREIW